MAPAPFLLCLILSTFHALATQKDEVIRTGSSEVMLDLTVRDKKGQRVTNLVPGDLKILDNGRERKISSFKLVEGSGTFSAADEQHTQAAAGANSLRTLDPLREIRLVTLIFSRLDLNSRTIARQSALDLLKSEFPQNVHMAVLVLGDSLQAITPFTNDLSVLRKGVERATGGTYSEFISDSARIQAQVRQSSDPAGAAMAQMMTNMLQMTRTSELAQTGRSAIFGLLKVVREQYRLPGRKSILFFSPGFGIPQGMEEPWKELISTANRFNVTFYAIDARGLLTENLNTEANAELQQSVDASMANQLKGNGTVTTEMAQAMDTAMDAGKANGQNTLADLAQSTGGFLLANSNDFRNQLKKVAEDIQTYYQLTYDPKIEKFDGTFHRIKVLALRPGLSIQARSGYFALPPSATALYELPLLSALNNIPLPRAFPFQSAGVHFKAANGQTSIALLDVPISSLTLKQVTPEAPYQGGLNYLVLVRDANNEVIHKLQGQVPVAANAGQLAEIKQSYFLYHESLDLAPSRYTLDAIVSDQGSGQVSARKSVFTVPAVSSKLSMSSVTIVRSLNLKAENTLPQDPFLMAGKVINPVISPVFKKADTISFYLVVYPDQTEAAKPQLTMRFSKDGELLAGGSPALGDMDESGRIQCIATAPVDKLPPGNYQAEFRVTQGPQVTSESVYFTLE